MMMKRANMAPNRSYCGGFVDATALATLDLSITESFATFRWEPAPRQDF